MFSMSSVRSGQEAVVPETPTRPTSQHAKPTTARPRYVFLRRAGMDPSSLLLCSSFRTNSRLR